jgi:DNA repair exonuclease SbcCD ATPase subunit
MMPKFPVLTLFLMSILLAGVVTPTINGFQILGFVTTNTYIDFAFAQTENTEETEDTAEDETEDVDDEDDIRSLGQDVSDFVHDASDEFRTQKEETKAIITACREALQNAVLEEQNDIRMQCREDLNEVRESYQELRRTYHDVFKEFRVPVRAIMSGDDSVSTIDAINLRAQQEEFKDRIHDLRIQMREELKAEVDDLRKQMREEREKMREEMQKIREEGGDKLKEELQSMREKMKEEREQMKEQMKEEREKMKEEREQMKEEQEKMNEESEKTRESEEKSN